MRRISFASIVALAFAVGTASADEIPNPDFVIWSKFKPGTSITTKTASAFGNSTSESTTTVTLVEVGAEKLTIELSSSGKAFGLPFYYPPTKQEVKKTVPPMPTEPANKLSSKVEKRDGQVAFTFSYSSGKGKEAKPVGKREEGTETLKIGGRDVKTTWVKFESEVDGVKTLEKTWTSDDVPTNVVKREVTTTSGTFISTSKVELIRFKKP